MNSQRMLRALEVVLQTGHTLQYYHNKPKQKRNFQVEIINNEIDKAILYNRISNRVDTMMRQGQLDEAIKLYEHRHLNALQTVGYTELFDYLDGKISLDKAIELIKQHTRNYAKRQLTWFRKLHK
jgi:tRNA dimethylallyltransferase